MANREDYDSPKYKAWRYACMVRDQFTCQLTGVKGGELEVHHIIPWAKAPRLRYVISNGITLSKLSHETVTGREEQYEEQFKKIIAFKQKQNGRNRKSNGTRKYKPKWRPRNPRLGF